MKIFYAYLLGVSMMSCSFVSATNLEQFSYCRECDNLLDCNCSDCKCKKKGNLDQITYKKCVRNSTRKACPTCGGGSRAKENQGKI